MSGFPQSGLILAATTGPSGIPLSTAAIPANNFIFIQAIMPVLNRIHLAIVEITMQVTSAMTGGNIACQVKTAGGVFDTGPVSYGAKGGLGFYHFPDNAISPISVFDADTVQVVQSSQLTIGAALCFANIWVL